MTDFPFDKEIEINFYHYMKNRIGSTPDYMQARGFATTFLLDNKLAGDADTLAFFFLTRGLATGD
jgi:hypothetical protein